MQLKVYRRDNRKKDQRRWHRYLFRLSAVVGSVRKLYYVDADGVVFKEVSPGENVKYPLLTGLRAEELTTSDFSVRRRIQDAIRLAELMAQRSHSLSEIHFDAPDRLVVYTT